MGFEWTFVEINNIKAKKFYNSKIYKDYIKNSVDGCSASTIQGLHAINELINKKFINTKDIIINGNSGDFISGGHIPYNIPKYEFKKNNFKNGISKILLYHFDKHYSLWKNLKSEKNKI